MGYRTKHVEIAKLRRYALGVATDVFFDPSNELGSNSRKKIREEALNEAVDYLKGSDIQREGQVVILDATNGTASRRGRIYAKLASTFEKDRFRVLYVECECSNFDVVEKRFLENYERSPDYSGLTPRQALSSFRKKVQHYETEYVGLSEETVLSQDESQKKHAFVKVKNFGEELLVHNVRGFLESKLVSFLLNVHTEKRRIILARHGQSVYNLQDRIGGDSALTETGKEFSVVLADWVGSKDVAVWTSTLRRAVETGQYIDCDRSRVEWNALMEIDAGKCEGMTYAEIRTKLPLEFAERQKNKMNWRYPRGESYVDVKKRLEPLIFELERQRHETVVVVAHRAVLRCLLSYFVPVEEAALPYVDFPLHEIRVLEGELDWTEKRVFLGPEVEEIHENDAAPETNE